MSDNIVFYNIIKMYTQSKIVFASYTDWCIVFKPTSCHCIIYVIGTIPAVL